MSEREFMVETMYEGDPDGGSHVQWLHALLLSLHDGGEQREVARLAATM
jgi:hypothetical protein